jgi:glutamate dehydrogenase (NADP+)
VQGLGNAGYHVARLLQGAGYRIVAVSDSKRGIYAEDGFDIESLYQHKQDTRKLEGVYCEGSVCEMIDSKAITNAELLELDVDLLIPAALEGVIGGENAKKIRAKWIAEVANGPIEGNADPILQDAGIDVLPDVLTNAGGVTVSYFEWVQNRQGYPWTLETVRDRLEDVLSTAFAEMWRIHEERDVPLRAAAYMAALERIGAAIEGQGTQTWFTGGK